MFIVYVLQDKLGRVYKGQTNNLERRFDEHKSGYNKSTKHFIEPRLVYKEEYETREEAVIREKYLKTAAGRRFLKEKLRS